MQTDPVTIERLKEIIKQSQKAEKAKKSPVRVIDNETQCFKRQQPKKLNPKFCVPWDQLELDLQINRLIEFSERYAENKDLPTRTSLKIRKVLIQALVKTGSLFQVEYDSSVGMIQSIPKLYYNDQDGYYIGTYTNDKGEFISRVSRIARSTTNTVNQVSKAITTEDLGETKSQDKKSEPPEKESETNSITKDLNETKSIEKKQSSKPSPKSARTSSPKKQSVPLLIPTRIMKVKRTLQVISK